MAVGNINRRTALSVLVAGSVTAACGASAIAPSDAQRPAATRSGPADQVNPSTASGSGPTVIDYGPDPSQFGELTVPPSPGRTLVVLIHGGFWFDAYDLDLARPLAVDLAGRGYPVWNLEYRRNGNGGGYPATFQDIADGIDFLASLVSTVHLSFEKLVVIGHSAGGQLGVWAASRRQLLPGAPGVNPKVLPTGVISQAGVLDLARAADEGVGGDAVPGLMGGYPADYPDRYAAADPIQLLPTGIPVRCLHGDADTIVLIDQSESYVAAAVADGDDATLILAPGDHLDQITVGTSAWDLVVSTLKELSA